MVASGRLVADPFEKGDDALAGCGTGQKEDDPAQSGSSQCSKGEDESDQELAGRRGAAASSVADVLFRSEWFLSRVLTFSSWETRLEAMLIAKMTSDQQEAYWSFLCMRLAEERCLTLLPRRFFPKLHITSAKAYFQRLWKQRNRFLLAVDPLVQVLPSREKLLPEDEKNAQPEQDPTEESKQGEVKVSPPSDADASEPEPEQVFQTVCRFRPASCFRETAENTSSHNKVTIPLHQRVSLWRQKGFSKVEAQKKALAFERGLQLARRGAGTGAETSTGLPHGAGEDEDKGHDDAEEFAFSLKPSSGTIAVKKGDGEGDELQMGSNKNMQKEEMTSKSDGSTSTVAATSSSTSSVGATSQYQLRASILNFTGTEVYTLCPGVGAKRYEYDDVLGEKSHTLHLFDLSLPLINTFLNGEDSCIFCYGQTGSGKTFTMFGEDLETTEDLARLSATAKELYPERETSIYGEASNEGRSKSASTRTNYEVVGGSSPSSTTMLGGSAPPTDDRFGLIPHALLYLLRKKPERLQISLSFVEVFGNQVRDLLTGRPVVSLLTTPATEKPLDSANDIFTFLQAGAQHKRAAATAMNEKSTRAHAVVIAKLHDATGEPTSKFVLVDLGGSEKLERSRVHEDVKAPGGFVSGDQVFAETTWAEYYKSRTRVQETAYINLGLLSLKRCIAALLETADAEKMKNIASATEQHRIPFYDSKLTQIMRDSLLSRNLLCVICAGPEEANAVETIASLRFGETCRQLGSTKSNKSTNRSGTSASQHGQQNGGSSSGGDLVNAVRVLDDRIKALQADIKSKEKWEWRVTQKTDVVDAMEGVTKLNAEEEMELGGLGAVEFLKEEEKGKKDVINHSVGGYFLVGAEEENLLLAKLSEQRRMLVGEA